MFNFIYYVIVFTFCIVKTTYSKDYELINRITGEVQAEIFNYYQIDTFGNVVIELQTVKGDADIYVSESNEAPTYDPHEYDLNSVTCGMDRVEVPYDFKRPFTIGIYGHPSHSQSSYILSIYKTPYGGNTILEDKTESKNSKNHENHAVSQNTEKKKSSSDVSTKIGIWVLLDVMEMIFF